MEDASGLRGLQLGLQIWKLGFGFCTVWGGCKDGRQLVVEVVQGFDSLYMQGFFFSIEVSIYY